jgi:hypothetical protein
MLLIIEIAMFMGGIYSIISARVPSFLVGGGKYKVEGRQARIFGILLLLPLSIALWDGLLLGLLIGDSGVDYVRTVEFLVFLGVSLLSIIFIRVFGKKNQPVNDIESVISRKAIGSLVYAILSAPGLTALICCPLAVVYANQALSLIDEHGVGVQYCGKAKAARVIAGVVTILWILAIAFVVISVIVIVQ